MATLPGVRPSARAMAIRVEGLKAHQHERAIVDAAGKFPKISFVVALPKNLMVIRPLGVLQRSIIPLAGDGTARVFLNGQCCIPRVVQGVDEFSTPRAGKGSLFAVSAFLTRNRTRLPDFERGKSGGIPGG